MTNVARAAEPFHFSTRLNLTELTGLRASTVAELREHVRTVSGSCIYYHTHRYLQQHQFLSPEPPNDFAHWVREALGERELAECLASIDTTQYGTIRGLRERIAAEIERHLSAAPSIGARRARVGEEFHFMKSVSFVLPTGRVARDLTEFVDILRVITVDSIYFHMFEARLRLERGANDFSLWIEQSLGDKGLAAQIARLDPYTRTMDNLRRTLIRMIEERIGR